jgi:hypothetical protein
MDLWIAAGAIVVIFGAAGVWVGRAIAARRRRQARVTEAEWDALVDRIATGTMLDRSRAERWVQWFRGTDVPRSAIDRLPHYAASGIDPATLVRALRVRPAPLRRVGVGRRGR